MTSLCPPFYLSPYEKKYGRGIFKIHDPVPYPNRFIQYPQKCDTIKRILIAFGISVVAFYILYSLFYIKGSRHEPQPPQPPQQVNPLPELKNPNIKRKKSSLSPMVVTFTVFIIVSVIVFSIIK